MWTAICRVGVVVFLALAPASPPAGGPATAPAYATGWQKTVVHDGARKKEIDVWVAWPAAAPASAMPKGGWPVVMLCHGMGGSGRYMDQLARSWAGRGFVVLCPTHDSDSMEKQPRGERSMTGMLRQVAGHGPEFGRARTLDCKAVLDHLADVTRALNLPKTNGSQFTASGHSLGAYTAMLLAGAKPLEGGKPQDFSDPRVKACIVLSGQGPGMLGLTRDSFGGITVPVIMASGSKDRGAGGETPEQKLLGLTLVGSSVKEKLYIEGADHMTFSCRRVVADEPEEQRMEQVKTTTGEFLDKHGR
jgi:predicted dienelactone hydrolase